MFAGENLASIYSQGMRDRSLRSGTKFAREIQLTDWSTAGSPSNRSSGVQIPRDICTRFGRYLYSTRCSWIIMFHIMGPRASQDLRSPSLFMAPAKIFICVFVDRDGVEVLKHAKN